MMRFWMVALIGIALSGCALLPKQTVVIGGVEDFIRAPKGSKICNVPLPTDENKTYCIVAPKDMVLVSLEGWNRVEKYK